MENIKEKPIVKSLKLSLVRFITLIVIPSVVILFSIGFYYNSGRYVKTENAYVKAPIISIQSQVSGIVETIYIKNNEKVKSGQKLFKIDTKGLELDLEEQKENLNTIKQEIQNRKAKLNEAKAEVKIADERLRFYKSEYKRIKNLVEKGVGLRSKLEEAEYQLNSSRQQLRLAEQKKKTILTVLFNDENINVLKHPLFLKNLTKLNRIKLDIARSVIYANQDGFIAKMNMEVGEYIDVGDTLFSIVDKKRAWVEANLKETDLTNIEVGQTATFIADSYPSLKWNAKVESLSPATGAEFAILPPQNSSGNWVKVVQRIPVKLTIGVFEKKNNTINKIFDSKKLRVGMSVAVSIDTNFKKNVPSVFKPFVYIINLF